MLSLVDKVITPEINASLTAPICREEVRVAVFQQGPLKAPGSDGYPGIFYQKYWDIVGDDVFEAVRDFFFRMDLCSGKSITPMLRSSPR